MVRWRKESSCRYRSCFSSMVTSGQLCGGEMDQMDGMMRVRARHGCRVTRGGDAKRLCWEMHVGCLGQRMRMKLVAVRVRGAGSLCLTPFSTT